MSDGLPRNDWSQNDWTHTARPAEDLTPHITVRDDRTVLDFATADPSDGIDFPWWDTPADLAAFGDWLRQADAPDFSDADQGWSFDAARRGDRLYFRQGDLDTGEIFTVLSVDHAFFRDRFDEALTSFQTLLQQMRA